jgi:hypothetical protein
MLDKEYKYYKTHEKEFLKKYKNQVLVIKGEEIVGVYKDEAEAYEEAVPKFSLGTFLIQRCIPDDTVQTYHSRVIIPR